MNSTNPEANGRRMLDPADLSPFRFSRPRGTAAEHSRSAPGVPAGQPPRMRSRGRLLIATLLLLACSAGIATVWDSLLRYQAYGVVTGRIIEVGVPMEGVLTSVNVSEGDVVRQDTRLARVVDLETEQQLARVSDELRVAEAKLQAEISRVQWQSHVEETEMTKSIAELFETTGRMYDESGELDLLRYQLDLSRDLHGRKASSSMDLETYTIQERAKEEELESLRQAIEVLKGRAERAVSTPRLGEEQIQPLIAQSELLLNDIARLREKIAQGDLRSPVNGTILRRHHPAGECVASNESLFSVMEESSLEIEIYLPQHLSHEYRIGDTVELKIEPFEELIPCEVTSIGAEHRRPPEHIEIFYRSNVRLLPIRLKPPGSFAAENRLSIGSVAKLPHFGAVL